MTRIAPPPRFGPRVAAPATDAARALDAALDAPDLGVADGYEGGGQAAALPRAAIGLRAWPGAPTEEAVAQQQLRASIDAYLAACNAHPAALLDRSAYPPSPSLRAPPADVAAACTDVVAAAERRLLAQGCPCTRDDARGELTILPDDGTPLGRYAAFVARTAGERVAFSPIVLWRDCSIGSHAIDAKTIFASLNALVAGNPQQTERHEWLHAVFQRYADAGRLSPTNAFVEPLPGFFFFGPHAAYHGGFSVEELACSAYDLFDDARGLGALRRTVEGGDVLSARTAIARIVERVSWHIDVQAGQAMADKTAELCASATQHLANTPPLSIEKRRSIKLGRDALFLREQLGLADAAPMPFTIELSPRVADGVKAPVVDVRLVDPWAGLDLTFPIFDRDDVATVGRYLADLSDRGSLDALNALVARHVPRRLDGLVAYANAWSDAARGVRAARDACEDALDAVTVDAGALSSAVLGLQGAVRALRDVVTLGIDEGGA